MSILMKLISSDTVRIFSVTSSFCHVVLFAVVRILAIIFPYRIKQIITKLHCKIILVFIWFFSIGLVLIISFLVPIIISYLGILTYWILVLAYSFVCYRMCKRRGIQGNESTQRHRQQSDKHVLLYSRAITFMFCTCILPESLSNIHIHYHNHFVEIPNSIGYITNFLFYINPFLDSLLYFFVSYCKRRRANNALPNRNYQDQAANRVLIGNTNATQETSGL